MIENMTLYVGMVISGLCGGIGSAFGAYLVNKGVIRHLEKLEVKMKKNNINSSLNPYLNEKTK